MEIEPRRIDGFEAAYRLSDAATGLTAFLVIHLPGNGPSFGGIRVAPYPSEEAALQDALDLAVGMSGKLLLAGIEAGGAKTVVMDHPGLKRREALQSLGVFIESLGGRYICGRDMGFGKQEEQWVGQATKHIVVEWGSQGCGSMAEAAAEGIVWGMRGARAAAGEPEELRGATAAIQGLGATGSALLQRLAIGGMTLWAGDIDPRAIVNMGRTPFTETPPEQVLFTPCDFLAPCARGGAITEEAAARLACRFVAGSANHPLASDAAGDLLWERGIRYVPDILVNAGATLLGTEWALARNPNVSDRIRMIRDRVEYVLTRARETATPPHRLVGRIAQERIAQFRQKGRA